MATTQKQKSPQGRTTTRSRRFPPEVLTDDEIRRLLAVCLEHIGVISTQLGHRSIATTAHYLDHIAPWSVVEAMRIRQWEAPTNLDR